MEEAGKLERRRGFWTEEEDIILTEYVRVHGKGRWNHVSKVTDLKRSGKSCRLRWINYLNPGTKHGNFSEEEEDLIIRLHNLLGNRWSLIAGRVPGRTDNQVKNHWNTHLRKKLGMINKPDYNNTKSRRSSSRTNKKRPSCSTPQPHPVSVVQAYATENLSSSVTATTSETNSEQPPKNKNENKKCTPCSVIQEDDGSKVTTQDYDYCFSSPHQEMITKTGNNNEHYCYYDCSSSHWLFGDDSGGGGLILSQPQHPGWMDFVNDYPLDFF